MFLTTWSAPFCSSSTSEKNIWLFTCWMHHYELSDLSPLFIFSSIPPPFTIFPPSASPPLLSTLGSHLLSSSPSFLSSLPSWSSPSPLSADSFSFLVLYLFIPFSTLKLSPSPLFLTYLMILLQSRIIITQLSRHMGSPRDLQEMCVAIVLIKNWIHTLQWWCWTKGWH